jgi:hypothetical protein
MSSTISTIPSIDRASFAELINLSFGFFHSKIGNFSVNFRRFALENSLLSIPFEQILRTLPRAIAYFRSEKTQNSGY